MAKQRKMTSKLFARAAVGNDPSAFIAKHLEWLSSHKFIAPLLKAYQEQQIDAEVCIRACREALLLHDIRVQISKAEESMKRSIEKIGSDNYTITIYTKFLNGDKWDIKIGTQTKKHVFEDQAGKMQSYEEEVEMIFHAHMFQFAERIATLKLSKREDSVFAEIVNNYGKKIITTISRDMALALMFPKDKQPFCKRQASGESKPFKNFQRSHNDRASFSRG